MAGNTRQTRGNANESLAKFDAGEETTQALAAMKLAPAKECVAAARSTSPFRAVVLPKAAAMDSDIIARNEAAAKAAAAVPKSHGFAKAKKAQTFDPEAESKISEAAWKIASQHEEAQATDKLFSEKFVSAAKEKVVAAPIVATDENVAKKKEMKKQAALAAYWNGLNTPEEDAEKQLRQIYRSIGNKEKQFAELEKEKTKPKATPKVDRFAVPQKAAAKFFGKVGDEFVPSWVKIQLWNAFIRINETLESGEKTAFVKITGETANGVKMQFMIPFAAPEDLFYAAQGKKLYLIKFGLISQATVAIIALGCKGLASDSMNHTIVKHICGPTGCGVKLSAFQGVQIPVTNPRQFLEKRQAAAGMKVEPLTSVAEFLKFICSFENLRALKEETPGVDAAEFYVKNMLQPVYTGLKHIWNYHSELKTTGQMGLALGLFYALTNLNLTHTGQRLYSRIQSGKSGQFKDLMMDAAGLNHASPYITRELQDEHANGEDD